MKKLLLVLTTALATSALAATSAPKDEKVVWDAWYTVTLKDKTHYGYYNDKLEIRQGKLFGQNRYWKNEENFINEETLGVFAAANLTPLFFNFRRIYRSNETIID